MSVYGFDDIHNKKRVIPIDDIIVIERKKPTDANPGEIWKDTLMFANIGLNKGDKVVVLSLMTQNAGQVLNDTWECDAINNTNIYPQCDICHENRFIAVSVLNDAVKTGSLSYRLVLMKITDNIRRM